MGRIFKEGVESRDLKKNIKGEDSIPWLIDVGTRKYEYQTGIDTLVVHTVNDEY